MIYFKKSLVSTALEIVKIKGTGDKLKAKNDIDQIDAVLTSYCNGYGYDPVFADQLDKRIVQEYPIIMKFNSLSPVNPSCIQSNAIPSISEPIINNLNQDRYGIMFDVLLKEGYIHALEDFVDRVE